MRVTFTYLGRKTFLLIHDILQAEYFLSQGVTILLFQLHLGQLSSYNLTMLVQLHVLVRQQLVRNKTFCLGILPYVPIYSAY